jgi:hypothetical protein
MRRCDGTVVYSGLVAESVSMFATARPVWTPGVTVRGRSGSRTPRSGRCAATRPDSNLLVKSSPEGRVGWFRMMPCDDVSARQSHLVGADRVDLGLAVGQGRGPDAMTTIPQLSREQAAVVAMSIALGAVVAGYVLACSYRSVSGLGGPPQRAAGQGDARRRNAVVPLDRSTRIDCCLHVTFTPFFHREALPSIRRVSRAGGSRYRLWPQ